MIVCMCLGVSERDLRAVVAAGAWNTEAVGAACGAGTDCGACRVLVECIVAEAARGSHLMAGVTP